MSPVALYVDTILYTMSPGQVNGIRLSGMVPYTLQVCNFRLLINTTNQTQAYTGKNMDIVTRQEAIKHKLTKYFSGIPCKNGHTSERTITGSCIACRAEWGQSKKGKQYRKSYYQEYKHTDANKKAAKKAMDDHRERRRQQLFDMKKEMSCVYCGESNPLCIDMDHIDHSSKTGTPATMVMSGTKWEAVLDELDKCQPVCRNCHNIKTIIEAGKLKNQNIDQYVPASMKHLMRYT